MATVLIEFWHFLAGVTKGDAIERLVEVVDIDIGVDEDCVVA
jgi:hypothetical protein